MQSTKLMRNAGQIYLSLVPFIATFIAFVIGHSNYKIYLPIWIINVCFMIISAWILGAHALKDSDNVEKKQFAVIGLFLIVPWIFISVFAGIGVPPGSMKVWVGQATEEQVRFSILLMGGILITLGLALLREKLKASGENFYSLLGYTLIMMAIPLYLINITFWHSFTLETFRTVVSSGLDQKPEWYQPAYKQVSLIIMIEVVLTYLATACFAASLYSAGLFRKAPSRIYIIISLLAVLIILLTPFYPPSLREADFPYTPFMIPAMAFLMLYFIGINLLRKAGN